jgi:hypothetical protein
LQFGFVSEHGSAFAASGSFQNQIEANQQLMRLFVLRSQCGKFDCLFRVFAPTESCQSGFDFGIAQSTVAHVSEQLIGTVKPSSTLRRPECRTRTLECRRRCDRARNAPINRLDPRSQRGDSVNDGFEIGQKVKQKNDGRVLDFHSFRHLFAVSLRGIPKELQKRILWTNSEAICSRYCHPNEIEDLRERTDAVNSRLRVA